MKKKSLPVKKKSATGFARGATKASAKTLNEIIDNSRIGIFRTTVKGKIIFGNSALITLLGYKTLADIQKLNLSTDIYKDPSQRNKLINKLEKKGFIEKQEIVLLSKNKKEIPVLFSAQAKYDRNNNFKFLDGFIEDISLFKQNENRIKRVNEHLKIINYINSSLSKALDLDDLLERCVRVILSHFSSDVGGVLYLLQDDWLVPESFYPEDKTSLFFPIKIGSYAEFGNISTEVYLKKKEFLVNNTHEKRFLKKLPAFKNEHAHSFGIFPVISGDDCIGILNIFSEKLHFFDSDKIELFHSIVNQLAVYINNSEIYQKTKQKINESKKKLDEVNLSYEISNRLSAHLEFDKIIAESFDILKEQGFASAKIYLVSEDFKTLDLLSFYNTHDNLSPHEKIESGKLFSGLAVSNKIPIIINDSHNPDAVKIDPDLINRPKHSFASLPIILGDTCLGALTISSTEINRFKKSAISFCDAISSQLSYVLNNAVLHSHSLKKNNELIQLYNTINRLSKHIEKDAIIQEAFDIFRELGFISGKLYKVSDDGKTLLLSSVFCGREGTLLEEIKIGEKFSGKAALYLEPVIVNDTHSEENILLDPNFKNDVRHSFASFPLEYENRCIGVLSLVGSDHGRFTEEIVNLCVNISKQLSLLLMNSEVHEKTEKRYEEVNLLYKITKRLSLHISLNEIINECFDFFKELGFSDGKVYLCNHNQLDLFALYSISRVIPEVPKEISEGKYFSNIAFETGKPVVINKTHGEEMNSIFPEMTRLKEHSFAVFPITFGDIRSGVLNLACDEPNGFNDFTLNLITNITHHLGVLINNSNLYEELIRKNRDLRILNELSQELNKRMNLEEGCRIIAKKLEETFDYDGFYIDLYDEKTDSLSNVINIDLVDGDKKYFVGLQNRPVQSPLIRKIINQKEPVLLLRENENDQIYGLIPFGNEQKRALSLMYSPLFTGDEILGVIAVHSYRRKAYSEEDLNILTGIANYISISLKNIILYRHLSDSENRYRTLIKNAPEAIYSFTKKGVFIAVNSKTCEFLQSSESLLLGKPMSSFLPEKVYDVFIEHFRSIEDSSAPKTFELRMENGNCYETTLMPIIEDGNMPKYYVGITRDITSQKTAEENNIKVQHQLSENKRHEFIVSMTRNIAHVFNNVLVNVLSRSSFAKTLVEKESVIYPHLEKIEVSSKRVGELVKQLLIFAQSGNYVLETLDLNKIIQFFFYSKKPRIEKAVIFDLELSEITPYIIGNRDQIIVILDKLFTNSIEAIGEAGKIVLSSKIVETVEQNILGSQRIESGRYGVLSVVDNGCGIRDDIKNRFFEPFNTTKEYGRGLGLASVFGIVMNMNGFINISSSVDNGATIDVYFPLKDDAAE